MAVNSGFAGRPSRCAWPHIRTVGSGGRAPVAGSGGNCGPWSRCSLKQNSRNGYCFLGLDCVEVEFNIFTFLLHTGRYKLSFQSPVR